MVIFAMAEIVFYKNHFLRFTDSEITNSQNGFNVPQQVEVIRKKLLKANQFLDYYWISIYERRVNS